MRAAWALVILIVVLAILAYTMLRDEVPARTSSGGPIEAENSAPRRAVEEEPETADAEPAVRESEPDPEPDPPAFESAGPATLFVVEAGSDQPVPDVVVYHFREPWDWEAFEPPHMFPGPKTLATAPRRTDSRGRLPIGGGGASARLLVHAPGYAWTAIEIPHEIGGETRIELKRGGNLELHVPGWGELEGAVIWMTGAWSLGWIRTPAPDKSGTVLIEGAPAGGVEIMVKRGLWFESSREYGRGEVEIRVGETATLSIEVEPDAALPKVSLSVELIVPDDWRERPRWVTFEGLETDNAEIEETVHLFDQREARTFELKPPPLRPGRYLVEVSPYGWATPIEVTAGREHQQIVVPAPVDLLVQIVDASTGLAIDNAQLSFYMITEPRDGWGIEGVRRDRERGGFPLQVAPGQLVLGAGAGGYQDVDKAVTARAGQPRTVRIPLEPAGILVVRLRHAGKAYSGVGVRLRVERTNQHYGYGFKDGVGRIPVLNPGTWNVLLELPAGFKPVAAREVEVKAGETTEIVFDLERAD